MSEKFLDCLEPFQIVRKDFVFFLKSPYCLESFLIVWKVSGLSGKFQSVCNLSRLSGMWKVSILTGKFPDCLESFLIVWTVSGLSGKSFYCLESFCNVWQVSILSGKFLDCLEHFLIVLKNFYCLEKIVWSGKFPYCLESLHIVWKVLDCLEHFEHFLSSKSLL